MMDTVLRENGVFLWGNKHKRPSDEGGYMLYYKKQRKKTVDGEGEI